MSKLKKKVDLSSEKAIQKELGEIEDGKDEIAHLQKAIVKAKIFFITLSFLR